MLSAAKLKEIEKLSDADIIEDTMTTLKYYFGNHVSELKSYHITHWWKDPLTLGSYSFIPVGGSGEDCIALAEPVGERLFFAGEATDQYYLGTVHGAYLSGIREAQRICKN